MGVGAHQLSPHRRPRALQLRDQQTLSRKGQTANILGFAGVQERVIIARLMLLYSRACLQDCLLTSVWELG